MLALEKEQQQIDVQAASLEKKLRKIMDQGIINKFIVKQYTGWCLHLISVPMTKLKTEHLKLVLILIFIRMLQSSEF